MRKTSLFLTAAGAGLFALFTTRDARAVGPIDIEIAAKVGYGTSPNGGSLNPLGFGFGGRAGVSFLGLYAGVNVVDYLGGSSGPLPCPPNVFCESVTTQTLMYGGELGYGFKLSIVTIRPQLGVGNALFYGTGSSSSLYLEPGVTVLVSFGHLFLGADANFVLFPSFPTFDGIGSKLTSSTAVADACTIHGQLGVRF
jgi:hypothetical protein